MSTDSSLRCQICNSQYSRKDSLNRHLKTHSALSSTRNKNQKNEPNSIIQNRKFKLAPIDNEKTGMPFKKFAVVSDEASVRSEESEFSGIVGDDLVSRFNSEKLLTMSDNEDNNVQLSSSPPHHSLTFTRPSPLDSEIASVMENQKLHDRDKLKEYLKIVRKYLCPKRHNSDSVLSGSGHKIFRDNHFEPQDNSRRQNMCNSRKDQTQIDKPGNYNNDDFKGNVGNQIGNDYIGERVEETSTGGDDYDSDIEDDEIQNVDRTGSVYPETGCGIEDGEDENTTIVEWLPTYEMFRLKWYGFNNNVFLLDHLPWLQELDSLTDSLLVNEIRVSQKSRIFTLCEVALNILTGHIPIPESEIEVYAIWKEELYFLENENISWKTKRTHLSDEENLVRLLVHAVRPLFTTVLGKQNVCLWN